MPDKKDSPGSGRGSKKKGGKNRTASDLSEKEAPEAVVGTAPAASSATAPAVVPATAPVASATAVAVPPAPAPVKTDKKADDGDWWWKCTRCRNKKSFAKVVCLECPKGKQFLCHKCCALEHDWDGNQRFHSVEAIHPKQTTFLLSALLDAFLLPMTIFFVIRQTGIPEGYNDGIDVCPIVDRFREALFSFDAGVSLYTKHYFYFGCNLEDGYIRLWLDAFVRCIATDTDSIILLVLTALKAYAFHTFIIKKLFVPVGVFFEAIVSTLFYFGTTMLPDVDSWRIARPFRHLLTKAVDKIQPKAKRLPKTLPRSRPMFQFEDYFKYRYGRIPRQYNWFRETASNRLTAFSRVVFCIPVVVRVCIMFLAMTGLPFRWFFEAIAQVVVPDNFWNSPNINFSQVTKDGYSGVMLESFAMGVVNFVASKAMTWVPHITNHIVAKSPPLVLWIVGILWPHVKFLHECLWDNYIYLVFFTVFMVRWTFRFLYKRVKDRQQGQFNKLAEDGQDFTEFQCKMKWLPHGNVANVASNPW